MKKLEGKRKLLLYIIFMVIGGLLGFLYYKVVGCATGACPLTSNPYITTAYGGIMGFLIANLF